MSALLAGLTLLMIGDSHMASNKNLIATLQDQLMAQGATVAGYGACGVPPGAWVVPRRATCGNAQRVQNGPVKVDATPAAMTWSIDALLAQHHPKLLIVEIGDALAGYGDKEMRRGYIAEQVALLTDKVRAAHVACIWIGPSWGTEGGPFFKTFARVKEFSDYLATVVGPCQYVDSLTLSKPGEWATFDGQHYTVPGYQKWGLALSGAIVNTVTVKALVKK
jgi:hypothetical protein